MILILSLFCFYEFIATPADGKFRMKLTRIYVSNPLVQRQLLCKLQQVRQQSGSITYFYNLLLCTWRTTCLFDPQKMHFRGLLLILHDVLKSIDDEN